MLCNLNTSALRTDELYYVMEALTEWSVIFQEVRDHCSKGILRRLFTTKETANVVMLGQKQW